MSVVRFLATRQALALLARRPALSTLQNCRTFTSLTNNNNNNSTKAITNTTTTITAACGTQLQQTRDHKRFGHAEEKTPRLTKYFHFIVLSLFVISVLDWGKVKRLLIPKVDADAGQRPSDAAGVNGDKDSDDSDEEEDDDEDRINLSDGGKVKEKVGFRERKVC